MNRKIRVDKSLCKALQMNVCRYHFKAQDADCFFLMTEAKSSF